MSSPCLLVAALLAAAAAAGPVPSTARAAPVAPPAPPAPPAGSTAASGPAAEAAPALGIERIFADPPLDGRRPLQAQIAPGGSWVSFLKPGVADSEVLELWGQPLPQGTPRRLVSATDLLAGKAQKLTEAEKMALERKRISQRGITSYQWCGEDDATLLFPLSGDLYVARLTARGVTAQRLTTDDDVPEQDPACTKDGRRVAYVKRGNLVVHDLGTNVARPLTTGATATKTFGLADFIASEELGRFVGFWWSGDGARILLLSVDESGVGTKVRPQIFADRTELTTQRYPAAGEQNAVVTAMVVEVATGRLVPVPLPKDAEYVARGGFFVDGVPWLQVMNREQTKLSLLEIDAVTGTSRVVLDETDAAWVETHDDLRELSGLLLSGRPGLLWPTETSGRRQLVAVDRMSGVRQPLTMLDEPVDAAVCTDGSRVVFSAERDRGRAQDLFVVDAVSPTHPVTPLPGAQPQTTRAAVADKPCRRLLTTTSAWATPPRSAVLDIDGHGPVVEIPGDPPDPLLARVTAARPIVVDIVAADGVTPLNALYLPPAAAGSAPQTRAVGGRHPVIVHAYGGPTGSVVGWRWARQAPVFAHWQQQGFGVFLVDTRGMAHRDRAFTRAHKNAFGKVEVDDLFAAVRQLPERIRDVDASRLGFFGWSYGGTLAVRSVLDEKSPFAAAVAVAPVTDWTLYDTAYTERYIGRPVRPDGTPSSTYTASNLVRRAGLLSRPLLLVHGTADDNVLFEHSLRLMQALQDEGRVFQTAIYPGKAHGLSGRKTQAHVYRTITSFFVEKLGAAALPVQPR
jgi:dipeptidyl-peptidase-4